MIIRFFYAALIDSHKFQKQIPDGNDHTVLPSKISYF